MMKISLALAGSAVLALCLYQADLLPEPAAGAGGAARTLEAAEHWDQPSRLEARLTVEKYGPPQVVWSDRFEWRSRGPWKRIVVSALGLDPLEEVIDYKVPADRLQELARFTHGLRLYPGQGEVAACGDQESLNYLALNLADDIAAGRRTAAQANSFFLSAVELAVAGKSSPYLEGLLFKRAGAAR